MATVDTEPLEGLEPETGNDELGQLEERIQRTVALVGRLRQEKEAALKELAETQAAWEESQNANEKLSGENEKLSEELQTMKTERAQVRARLEKLLGHIDQLGAA
jgi:predicted nuclease with TOPRIM domain